MWLAWQNQPVLDQLKALHQSVRTDAWIFHNLLPVISLGAYRLARELNVPVIRWVNDYRPISPNGKMFVSGKVLEPEDRRLAWKEMWHDNWHGRLATAALALAYARARWRGDLASVKAWIALDEEVQQIFIKAGYPADKVFCLHHAWDIQPAIAPNNDDGYFLFLGRMVEEKGVKFLMELWRRPELEGIQLVMAGDGPLVEEYRVRTPPNIRWLGFVDGLEKTRLLAGCRAVLFPSLWAEPPGLVVYEAYEQGRPVLASAIGGSKHLVTDGQTGRLLSTGDPAAWAQAILEHWRDPALSRVRGQRGLDWLRAEASPAAWNRRAEAIIDRVLAAGVPGS
jgi:glycosyltransferase involved in cell wall biosynthesis